MSLPKPRHLLLIKMILCAIPVHAVMALNLPAKTLVAINKICCSFLLCSKAKANGGNCADTWEVMCAPKWVVGLGFSISDG